MQGVLRQISSAPPAGACGGCALKVTSGKIVRTTKLSPEHEKAGFALMCSTRALSDVTVVTHQAREYKLLKYAVKK